MSQFSKRLCFDLANSLAGYREVLADLFECVFAAVRAETEPHLDNLLFAGRERLEHLFGHFAKIGANNRVSGIGDGFVLDEVAQMRVFFLADRRLE